MQSSYQRLLNNTIKTLLNDSDNSVQAILMTVFESLMKAERDVFLLEHPEANKANGYYERFINHLQGRYEIRVPRDRQGVFSPLMLEVIRQDSQRMNDLALALYSQGVSQRGVKQVFEQVLGSRMSPGKLSALVKAFEPYRQAWQQRSLEPHYPVILIDALNMAVRRESVAKEAVYVVMGLKANFCREILGIYLLPEESSVGWKDIFDDLRNRGLLQVGLIISDELSGIEQALDSHLAYTHHQLCLVHKLRNLLARVRAKEKAALVADFHQVFNLDNADDSVDTCIQRLQSFIQFWGKRYPCIKNQLPEHKWHRYCAYLHYPAQVRRMLYTTNWIERLNKEIRKVTRHVNAFPNPDAALNLVYMVISRLEENTYDKPVTSFYPFKEFMNNVCTSSQTQNF